MIDPRTFQQKIDLDGTEEIYSQTGGISRRYTVNSLVQMLQTQIPLNPTIDYAEWTDEVYIGREYNSKQVFETIVNFTELEDFALGNSGSPTFAIGIDKLLGVSVTRLNVPFGKQRIYLSVNGESGQLTNNKYITFAVNPTGTLYIKEISPQITNDDVFKVTIKYTKL
jgi:hypothetical protein